LSIIFQFLQKTYFKFPKGQQMTTCITNIDSYFNHVLIQNLNYDCARLIHEHKCASISYQKK